MKVQLTDRFCAHAKSAKPQTDSSLPIRAVLSAQTV
jgi:hypothetical protein